MTEGDRRTRAELLQSFRADVDIVRVEVSQGQMLTVPVLTDTEGSEPACRCYRCGKLLGVGSLLLDHYMAPTGRLLTRPACGLCALRPGM